MREEAQRVPRLFTNNPFQGAALLSAAPLNPSPSAVGLSASPASRYRPNQINKFQRGFPAYHSLRSPPTNCQLDSTPLPVKSRCPSVRFWEVSASAMFPTDPGWTGNCPEAMLSNLRVRPSAVMRPRAYPVSFSRLRKLRTALRTVETSSYTYFGVLRWSPSLSKLFSVLVSWPLTR